MRFRLILIGAAIVAALAWFNWQMLAKERHAATGRPVFFELGTVDPRSLIQGDYMILRYSLADALPSGDLPPRGALAVKTGPDGVALTARILGQGEQPGTDELRVQYHRSGFLLNVGPDSFFFQEGEAETYARARYAELRVLPDGETLLVGLRDENLAPLGRAMFP